MWVQSMYVAIFVLCYHVIVGVAVVNLEDVLSGLAVYVYK